MPCFPRQKHLSSDLSVPFEVLRETAVCVIFFLSVRCAYEDLCFYWGYVS